VEHYKAVALQGCFLVLRKWWATVLDLLMNNMGFNFGSQRD
jgi:hypothetical protein